jgi:adenylosuccinate lyase
VALAEAERELGLKIEEGQIAELRAHVEDIDFQRVGEHEKRLRHDVMAHVHAFGEAAVAAKGIIHLGATSQYVVCNTELIQMREGLGLLAMKLANAIDVLGSFGSKYKAEPTWGLTHFQPAQPTTVGKRASLWAYELSIALEEVEHRLSGLRFRGVKGTTGTQGSFLELFGGDTATAHRKVEELDRLVATKMGWDPDRRFVVTGQTYPRVVDGLVVSSLAAVAAASQKFATDMRLLANRKELEEPFEAEQVGSSAMAYKRNPMRCERVCGLARFVIGMVGVPFTTAAEQWLERTLDDSSTRRLSLPEPFLAVDGLLELVIDVSRGIVVYEKTIAANLAAELPFMATENILMAAVQGGADRQEAHEVIRRRSMEVAVRIKSEGGSNDLLKRLAGERVFAGVQWDRVLAPAKFIGRAPQQVDEFMKAVVEPIRERYRGQLGYKPRVQV